MVDGGPFNVLTKLDEMGKINISFEIIGDFWYRLERTIVRFDGEEQEIKTYSSNFALFMYSFHSSDPDVHQITIFQERYHRVHEVFSYIVSKKYLIAEGTVDGNTHQIARFNKAMMSRDVDRVTENDHSLFKSMKDDSGEVRSRSEGKLCGFYLGTRLAGGGAHLSSSPFGDRLFLLNHRDLIDERTSLYFNGFYCYGGEGSPHYISLVLTKDETDDDRWCFANLTLLNIYDNPFLFLHENESETALVAPAQLKSGEDLYVETFVCDTSLSIRGIVPIQVHLQDRHSSSPTRCYNCRICCW
ncbi:hypothetical protein PFISCL1PPCAC_23750 [Pristionchus fissidentatus]|uniref:Phytanoyl-CoA hydroxylase-interacting protein-like C-terminal domain-containing protein n=1 Tax=Pristionchus fissidentatus TaxID=1538716 RepID=A0AAV5WPA4_9BILA|nr:hypothetical protein PFISCL1PPCAC_23750 [Pristionchus fissidentatus]